MLPQKTKPSCKWGPLVKKLINYTINQIFIKIHPVNGDLSSCKRGPFIFSPPLENTDLKGK